MPYFTWRGVDIEGAYRKGSLYAKNPECLDSRLLSQDIALIRHKRSLTTYLFIQKKITVRQKIELFEQAALLLKAGVLLPDALSLLADNLSSMYVQDYIHAVADAVREGKSLSQALRERANHFDSMTLQLIKAGEESGNLAPALDSLAQHYMRMNAFAGQVRSALLMPVITIFFFLAIAAVAVICIIPRFAQLFTSLSKPIPAYTQNLLLFGEFLTSVAMVPFACMLGAIVFGVNYYRKTAKGQAVCTRLLEYTPFINSILRLHRVQRICESLSLLLGGGIQIIPALRILGTSKTVGICNVAQSLEKSISCGVPLHRAIQEFPQLFNQQLVALMLVGQESGTLPAMLLRIAQLQEQLLQKRMTLISQLAQPITLICLGIFVALLVASIYGPLLSLASLV